MVLPSKNQLKFLRSLQKKKYRNVHNVLLVEGIFPILEAIKAGYLIKDLYYTPYIKDNRDFGPIVSLDCNHFEIDGALLKKISSEVTPQGVVAVIEQKKYSLEDFFGNILVLDKIQDPGNLGTLIRIAHWFGLGGVLLVQGTVDISNPKVIRSSKGSIFHIPYLYSNSISESLEKFESHKIYVSDVYSGESIQNYKHDNNSFMLVIGNESQGVSDMWNDIKHTRLTLPAFGSAESLNAAVACSAILSKMMY